MMQINIKDKRYLFILLHWQKTVIH